MHVITHLSDKYEKMRTPENGWSEEEAGMAQLDDIVGTVMAYLKDQGLDNDTIVAFSTDNGAENFTWPDGGQTPFAGAKGPSWKADSGCRQWSAGQDTFLPAKSKTV
jgi:arylsulfatase A-like enzyme